MAEDKKHILLQNKELEKIQSQSIKEGNQKIIPTNKELLDHQFNDAIDEKKDQQEKAEKLASIEAAIFDADRDGNKKLNSLSLANVIVEDFKIITYGLDRLSTFFYDDKKYVQAGENFIGQKCQEFSGGKITISQVREVVGHIQRITWREDVPFDNVPVHLINFRNGVFDIKRKVLLEHSPDFYFRYIIPHDFIPNIDCPRIKKFLEKVLDVEDIQCFQEFCGFLLYRKYHIKKAAIFYGPRNTGKTTVINLLVFFIDPENTSGVSLHRIVYDKFAAYRLYGTHLNSYDDLSVRDIKDVGEFKISTGGGYISAEKKFGDSFEFINYAKLLFATNRFSAIDDADDLAYYERWLIFVFSQIFDDDTADRNILEKLTTPEEMSGFINWALDGLQRLLDNGHFSYTKSAEDNRSIMERNSEPISAFVQDCLIQKDESWIATDDLIRIYSNYCIAQNLSKVSDGIFTRVFGKRCRYAVSTQRDATGKDGNLHRKKRGWLNVGNVSNTSLSIIAGKGKDSSIYGFDKYVTSVTKKEVKEETIQDDPLKFDNKLLVHIPCSVEGCPETECNMDSKNKPFCQKHWNTEATK